MKHKLRLYELTVVIPERKGKPSVTKKFRFRSIDSVHASATIMKFYGRTKVKVISAVLVKEDDE